MRMSIRFSAASLCVAVASLFAVAGSAGGARVAAVAMTSSAPDLACAAPAGNAGADHHGETLSHANFSRQSLVNARFAGATLSGVNFLHADLTGADFTGATIDVDTLPTDFSFANLTGACFKGLVVRSTVYFTYATVTCAAFDGLDLVTLPVVFGDAALRLDRSACRPRFRNAVMNCEFVADWNALDLSGAAVKRCAATAFAKGSRHAGAMLGYVDLSGVDLTGTDWAGAVLEHANFQSATLDHATGLNGTAALPARLAGAHFNKASAVGVNFSNAQLYGADFTYADLSNTSFAGSFLTSEGPTHEPVAAKFDGARLRNATFASANLQSASFVSANIYGSYPAGAPASTCETRTAMCPGAATGYTCGCASMAGADLGSADLSGAFLWGVDFANPGTVVSGTKFDGAVLIGANFDGVNLRVASGAVPSFKGAMLQGANLGANAAGLSGATLTAAFLDFERTNVSGGGNDVSVLLGSDHTQFRNWSGPTRACVVAGYNQPSVVPAQVSLNCPDGSNGVCGAGKPRPSPNPHWNSRTSLAAATPVPGWYALDATYDRATTDPAAVCGGAPVIDTW